MKKAILALFAVSVLLGAVAFVVADKPTTVTQEVNYAQYQWRGNAEFSGNVNLLYQNSQETLEYTKTGNTLHTSWEYSPLVNDLSGESTVYVYDKDSGNWIEHEGQVGYYYAPGYGDYQVVNFFRGYTNLEDNYGVAYQWVYLYAPEDSDITTAGTYTEHAIWDDKVGAWLVGFSIYIWDGEDQNLGGTIAIDLPNVSPVPASNYNPLNL